MVLHDSCSAPGPWSGSTGEMISSRSGNNTRELCCIWRSRRLYSQPNCSLYCTLYCCRYYCYSFRFSFLSHSFTVRTYARSLTMATADAGDPSTELEPPPLSLKSQVWKYFGFPVSYVDKKATVCKLCRN